MISSKKQYLISLAFFSKFEPLKETSFRNIFLLYFLASSLANKTSSFDWALSL